MKWPSLESLWRDTLKVIARFPLQVMVTLLALVVSFFLINYRGSDLVESNLVKGLVLCNLALVLLLSSDLFAEVNQLSLVKKWALRFGMFLICGALYFTLHPSLYTADIFRMALLAFAFHLLVSFAPFIKKGNLLGFWEYNKILFLRFLMAALYSLVLFGGLAIALVAISQLFNVKIEWFIYVRLLALVGIGFNTLFFLAGVPADFKVLNEVQQPYPKELKIFAQYVLIPLLSIYLLILLVYETKILISWELPKGLVSMLILGYAVFGVLSLLLIYPIKEKEGNGWIRLFSRFFYLMMIPLVVLLLLAVWTRVGHYGITESRYILVVLALWLTIITVYFLISKKDNIKIIPISLCILALLATYGPQSAFSISRYSQIQRLKKINGAKDQNSLKEKPAIIRYLVTQHGLTALQQFTNVDLTAMEERIEGKSELLKRPHYEATNDLVDSAFKLLKVKEIKASRKLVVFKTDQLQAMQVKGYDYLLEVDSYASSQTSRINEGPLLIKKIDNSILVVKIAQDPEVVMNTKNIAKVIASAYHQGLLKPQPDGLQYYAPHEKMVLRTSGKRYDLDLVLTELAITFHDNAETYDYNFRAYLLIKIK